MKIGLWSLAFSLVWGVGCSSGSPANGNTLQLDSSASTTCSGTSGKCIPITSKLAKHYIDLLAIDTTGKLVGYSTKLADENGSANSNMPLDSSFSGFLYAFDDGSANYNPSCIPPVIVEPVQIAMSAYRVQNGNFSNSLSLSTQDGAKEYCSNSPQKGVNLKITGSQENRFVIGIAIDSEGNYVAYGSDDPGADGSVQLSMPLPANFKGTLYGIDDGLSGGNPICQADIGNTTYGTLQCDGSNCNPNDGTILHIALTENVPAYCLASTLLKSAS